MKLNALDFSLFLNGTPQQQTAFCEDLLNHFQNYGLAKLINCGIPDNTILELLDWNKRFFDLPVEKKSLAPHPRAPNPHRGYSSFGQENVSRATFDAKESFDQGPKDDPLHPNIWLPEHDFPGFRAFMESFFDRCCNTQLQVLRALATAMKLPEAQFETLHSRNDCELRLTHYPAIDIQKLRTDTCRISEHHDWGTLTMVFQDSTGGLEFEEKTRPGTFHPVESSSPTEVIINVGDCLQRWTDGALHSVWHRVKIPPGLEAQPDGLVAERHSVSFFCKPNRDASLLPLDGFGDREKHQYEDITAYEYNQRLLKTTY